MGIVRFLLAAVVVLFHTTRMNWVPGRMAVDGFFVLSGFVITRTLLRNYRGGAVWRLFGNRLLRLGPPYIVVLVVAAVVAFVTVNWLHVPLADVHPYFFSLLQGGSDASLRSSLTLADMRPHVGVLAGGVPLLTFTPALIP